MFNYNQVVKRKHLQIKTQMLNKNSIVNVLYNYKQQQNIYY